MRLPKVLVVQWWRFGHLLLKHYNNLVQGIFDTKQLDFVCQLHCLGVFLTAQSIDALLPAFMTILEPWILDEI